MRKAIGFGFACLCLSSCASRSAIVRDDRLDLRYAAAVADAAVAEPTEVSTLLQPIAEGNGRLQWKGEPGARRVLVTTWTNWNGYDDKVGQRLPTTRDTFVTVVPEVRDFCRALHVEPARATLRLEQRLGLPPHNGKTKFVEMWVAPADLFRPCPDPEIEDRECQIDYPQSPSIQISDEHKSWIADLKSKSYGAGGYPWTRLGYTYDWGGESEFGASEFVIRHGSEIEIAGVLSTEAYCK